MYYKTVISLIAVALSFVSYIPYIRDIVRGKTKPHIFTWILWDITTLIVFFLQISAGAGRGAWPMLALPVVMTTVIVLGFRGGDKIIKKIDVLFFILAIGAIPLWLRAHQPIASIVLLSTIDMLGFLPTVRKSWYEPYSETLSLYVIAMAKFWLILFALDNFNIVTSFYPITWIMANTTFILILLLRRSIVSPPKF